MLVFREDIRFSQKSDVKSDVGLEVARAGRTWQKWGEPVDCDSVTPASSSSPHPSSQSAPLAVGRPSAPKIHVATYVPMMVHFLNGTSQPRARPTATDSGSRVLPYGGGQRTGARLAMRAGERRPKDPWRGHQNGSVWLAARDAPHSETHDGAMGSAVAYQHRHRQSDVHSGRADDGSPARFSEEVPADASG